MPNLAAVNHARTTRVVDAIRTASQQSGVDFGYLLQQARLESGLNPNAAAPTSSATGLYQFINQTWLAMVRRHGTEQGIGWAAQAVRQGRNGRLSVDDPAMRQQILDLRRNPELAASMAAAFASDNRAVLERHVSRPIENVDLYLAHFLGAGGATRFLTEHQNNPGATAADMFPSAARANRSIFFDRGRPRSLDEVRNGFIRRMAAASGSPVTTPTTTTPSAALPPRTPPPQGTPPLERYQRPNPAMMASATPQQAQRASMLARIAYMTLAELGG